MCERKLNQIFKNLSFYQDSIILSMLVYDVIKMADMALLITLQLKKRSLSFWIIHRISFSRDKDSIVRTTSFCNYILLLFGVALSC